MKLWIAAGLLEVKEKERALFISHVENNRTL